MDEKVRPLPEVLQPVNTDVNLTVVEVVRDQAKPMSTCKYNLVTCLFNQDSSVSKTFVHLSSYSLPQDIKAAHSTSSKW